MKQKVRILLKEFIHRSILALGATALLALATGAHADIPKPSWNSTVKLASSK